jgi:hypothetical protein
VTKASVSDSPARRGAGRYDHAERRASKRAGRERGCWLYVPADELEAAGFDPYAERPPFYRVWGSSRGGLFVRLYREK